MINPESMIEWTTNWPAWRLRKCLIFSTHVVLIFSGRHIRRFSLPTGVTGSNRKQTNTQTNRLRVVILYRLSLLPSQSLSASLSLSLLSPPPEGSIPKQKMEIFHAILSLGVKPPFSFLSLSKKTRFFCQFYAITIGLEHGFDTPSRPCFGQC